MISRPGAHDVAVYRRDIDGRMQELLTTSEEDVLAKLGRVVALGFRPVYVDAPAQSGDSGQLGWCDFDGEVSCPGRWSCAAARP